MRVRPGAWLAILVSAAAVAITWKLDVLNVPLITREQPAPAAADHNVVRLAARRGLRVRATVAGKWSVTDPRFGTVEVPVAVGKVPLAAITRALAKRGYRVSVQTP